jgi:hypothetical protein
MHLFIALAVGLALIAITLPVAAQDADALRQELTDLKRRLESMQQQYLKAIETLEERLKQVEQRGTPTAAPVVAPPAAPPPPATAAQAPAAQASASRPITPIDLVRPREPFALADRGRGALLFDIGIAGDFIANFASEKVDDSDTGTFAGRENRLFPREIELAFFGQIDPFARGEVRIEAAEEFEDGEREMHLGLAEANFTLLTLPFGTQAKAGLMRNRFGLLNQYHAHDLPQPDRPNVLTRFLGEEGLVEPGVELTWVPPLPFYLEALAGVFTGDNETAFGHGSLRDPLVTGRLRTFFELGEQSAIQLGLSGATGVTEDEWRQNLFGVDVKYKLTPEAWRHPLLTVGGEALLSVRRGEQGDRDRTTRHRFGWYAWAEIQPALRWMGGLRFDQTEALEAPGREWAIEPYLTFRPSEFLRFRLAYKHTDRDRNFASGNDILARRADEIFLQGTFLLGAHPAHPF